MRFIEFMPLEEGRTWSPDTVVTLEEILSRMGEYRLLVEIPRGRSETARRYRFDDGVGEIGIIAPVSLGFVGIGNLARGQSLGFHLQVDFCIDVGGVERNMPEPGPNRVDVHAGTEKVGGGRVANRVRANPFFR